MRNNPIALTNWDGNDSTLNLRHWLKVCQLKAQLMPVNPRIAESKGGSLSYYTEGKWKNYNTVLESAGMMWRCIVRTCRSSLA